MRAAKPQRAAHARAAAVAENVVAGPARTAAVGRQGERLAVLGGVLDRGVRNSGPPARSRRHAPRGSCPTGTSHRSTWRTGSTSKNASRSSSPCSTRATPSTPLHPTRPPAAPTARRLTTKHLPSPSRYDPAIEPRHARAHGAATRARAAAHQRSTPCTRRRRRRTRRRGSSSSVRRSGGATPHGTSRTCSPLC